jgi:hypothetical protein
MDSTQVATVLNRVMRKIDDGSIKPGNEMMFIVREFGREFDGTPGFDVAEFIERVNEGVI